jgi:hypothetical protein
VVIFTFSYKGLLGWIFLQYVTKNLYFFFNTSHFCIKFSQITRNYIKMFKLHQSLRFVLENYLNFKLYENMLIIIFIIFYYKLFFFFDVMYITSHLHAVKDFWNFKFLFNIFLINFFFKFYNFQIVIVFCVDNQLASSQFFFIKIHFIKRIFSLVICKIDFFLCNCCSSSKILY